MEKVSSELGPTINLTKRYWLFMFVKIIELQTILAKPPTKKCFLGPPNQLLLLHAIMQSRAPTPRDSREDPHEVPEASAGKLESSSVIRNQFITDT